MSRPKDDPTQMIYVLENIDREKWRKARLKAFYVQLTMKEVFLAFLDKWIEEPASASEGDELSPPSA
jgi:hypothetical protein